ncbi:MAG: adenylate/guanylate cyclase domain-containing protein [Terriglobales bacterium]
MASPSFAGRLQIAHVLFVDVVSYSVMPMDKQEQTLRALQEAVRNTEEFVRARDSDQLISLPTGDGMALVFFNDAEAPAHCAVQLSRALQSQADIKVRMGIHSGPVYRVADINANRNVAGGGINMAQRVMDCGDAGHILVSKSVADVLGQVGIWRDMLHDLGEAEVKHGVMLHIYNLYSDEIGHRELPHKLQTAPKTAISATARGRRRMLVAVGVLMAVLAVAAAFWLRRAGRGSAGGTPSIAVLPFVDMSSEKNQEYFSDGLAEELLNDLAKIPGLRVAARTSSFQFKGKNEDLRTVGEKLNVGAILEGSVRKEGSRVRITAQLIKVGDGFHLWSETYDREMNDIFAVQEDIGHSVAGSLKVALLGRKTAMPSAQGTNAEAYNAYLQGEYFLKRHGKENLEKAIGYYEQTIKLDPGYAPAWVGLAAARSDQADRGYLPVEEGYREAREAAERALALDANLAAAHAAMGGIKMSYDWDWAGADASYQQALALEPGNAKFVRNAAVLAKTMGRLDEALAQDRRAVELDPLSVPAHSTLGLAAYYAGRREEAAAALKKAMELNPEFPNSHALLGQVYLAQAHPQEALAEMEREPEPAIRLQGQALAYHALGRKKESDVALAELVKKYQADAAFQIAEVYAFRGEADRAFEWLERAYAQRDSGLAEMKGDPLLKSLERDPRYAAFLKKMRLPV